MKKSILDDTSIETLRGPSAFSHIILIMVSLFIVTAFIWSKYAILDEVTVGEGKVIPSQEIQIIQNLEGGIIRNIFVKEGQIVDKDEVLVQIDDTRFSASFKEIQQKIANLELDILRLTAETNDLPFEVPPEIHQKNPSLIQSKMHLHQTKLKEKTKLNEELDLVERELALMKPLVNKGAVSEVEVIRIERSLKELQGKLLAFNSKSLSELSSAKSELNSLKESHMADKDRLSRTTVRSPLKGIVKQVKIKTIGGVLQPGMDLIEIVPLDDTLLIEAKIRPADIGFIHPKQKAIVKLTAYDFSIYGGLEGTVEHISADTIVDDEDESFYVIRLRTKKNYLGTKAEPLFIIPGMMASVDILTGEKSVLDYILKPILKAREKALRER